MRISLNWLKKYVNIPVTDEELVRLIGARLVEVEGVIDETHKYDKIYVVRVEHAEKIPETHLTLCKINAGAIDLPKVEKDADGLVQVLCGAPNVREGMLAAWIAPGAIVPASVHEDAPFVIGKRKMLGKYDSNGMLAAADELDFGDDHEVIIEIDPKNAQPGDSFADVFELKDLILDIENKSLTHRPDCFGLIGFAREVAGILGQHFEHESLQSSLKSDKTIEVEIKENGICDRYSAIVLKKHGEIKKKYFTWMDTILAKSGMRPVSPIVDTTNYLMLLTGQPSHAFDYDKFVKVGGVDTPKIIVRLARDGEKLLLLDGREIELNTNDILITSNDKPVGLAGAMGGMETEITDETRNVILEVATFSLYNMRKTQMAHGIFSEAITRYTKGQPIYQTLSVAEECAKMLADGFQITAVADRITTPKKRIVVKTTTCDINRLLGTSYDESLIIKTLQNVGFEIKVNNGTLEVLVPEWRTDIHIKEDIAEEVGRLLGYDNIKPVLPLHSTADRNDVFDGKRKVRNLMTKYGANEVLTYSFVSGRLLEKAGLDTENSYKITNSISPELQYVRQSIVPCLLDKAYLNEKLPVNKFAIYEMNMVYRKEDGLNDEKVPMGRLSLGFVVAERKNKETAFYKAKKYLAQLLNEMNIDFEFAVMKSDFVEGKPFEPKRAAELYINGEYAGIVGEFKNSVKNEFKLTPYLAGFEINLELLIRNSTQKKKITIGRTVAEDITIVTDKTYAETLEEIQKQHEGAIITPGTIYQPEGQKTRNITFHIEKNVK